MIMIEITSNRPTRAIQLTGCKPSRVLDLLNSTNHITPMENFIQPYQRKVTLATIPKSQNIHSRNDGPIKGIRGLALYLGCGVNKAQQIMNSGVLIEEKIAYKTGHTWLMNREKLTVLLEANPRIFEKLSTK